MNTLNIPAALFQRWMQRAACDPDIKPARVIYARPATDQERHQLTAERTRLERRGRLLRYVGRG